MNVKNQKAAAIFLNLSAEFFLKEVNFKGGIVTVTAVDVTSDKNNATVWVALHNINYADFDKKISVLESGLRYYVSQHSKLHHAPHFVIKIDDSIDASQKIQEILK